MTVYTFEMTFWFTFLKFENQHYEIDENLENSTNEQILITKIKESSIPFSFLFPNDLKSADE